MKKHISLIAILLLCATSLFAQAPERFSYQAVVRNANNTIVANAQVGVRVSILQGSADGSVVYLETQTATTNANGLLTIEIGGGKAEQGEFAGIDWANGPYFLKTETDPNGGSSYTITSTQQLLSVPYAIYAKEAANGFSGDYNDLKNKPAIPQNIGELANDAGYITLNDLPNPSKGGGEANSNDAGIIYTTECGEVNLCELAQMRTALLPVVTTNEVGNVTETTASCGGNVTAAGYSEVTARGVCWSTAPNPTVSGSHTGNGSGTGTFTSSITSLAAGTTYHVRAYATNSVGTAYGEEVSFTTAVPCTAITLPYTENFDSYTTSTTAATGVQPDGWTLVREDVSVPDSKKPQLYYKSSFAHSGNYSLKMSNRCVYAMPVLSTDVQVSQLRLEMYLRQPNALYQLEVGVWDDAAGTFEWVQLINNSSTDVERVVCDFSNYNGNGRRIAFRNVLGGGKTWDYSYNYLDDITLDIRDGSPCLGTPRVTDHDGNVYNTVKIGGQCWTKENLRTTTSPSTGTYLIPTNPNTDYTYTGKQARWYKNDSAMYAPKNYGLLYNWNAAVDTFNTAYGETSVNTDNNNAVSVIFSGHRRGICPVGWHLPSDAEWTTLTNYVSGVSEYQCGGSSNNIAKALASKTGWAANSNNCAVGNNPTINNATGFSVVPAGYCNGSSFLFAGSSDHFWSATQYASDPYSVYGRSLYCSTTYLYQGSFSKYYGYSVRCLRD